jgi:hypothetical protein
VTSASSAASRCVEVDAFGLALRPDSTSLNDCSWDVLSYRFPLGLALVGPVNPPDFPRAPDSAFRRLARSLSLACTVPRLRGVSVMPYPGGLCRRLGVTSIPRLSSGRVQVAFVPGLWISAVARGGGGCQPFRRPLAVPPFRRQDNNAVRLPVAVYGPAVLCLVEQLPPDAAAPFFAVELEAGGAEAARERLARQPLESALATPGWDVLAPPALSVPRHLTHHRSKLGRLGWSVASRRCV